MKTQQQISSEAKTEATERVNKALNLIVQAGGTVADGHREWLLTAAEAHLQQVLRLLS